MSNVNRGLHIAVLKGDEKVIQSIKRVLSVADDNDAELASLCADGECGAGRSRIGPADRRVGQCRRYRLQSDEKRLCVGVSKRGDSKCNRRSARSVSIAVTLVYFSDGAVQSIAWTLIDSAAAGQCVCWPAINTTPRPSSGGTGIVCWPQSGRLGLFAGNGFEGTRQVIDVVGDGAESQASAAFSDIELCPAAECSRRLPSTPALTPSMHFGLMIATSSATTRPIRSMR